MTAARFASPWSIFPPGFSDSYLADHGFDSQQTDEPEDPNRSDNFWQPLPGDHGAHGRFDDRASPTSIQLELNLNRERIGPLVAIAAAALAKLTVDQWTSRLLFLVPCRRRGNVRGRPAGHP